MKTIYLGEGIHFVRDWRPVRDALYARGKEIDQPAPGVWRDMTPQALKYRRSVTAAWASKYKNS